MSCRGCTGRVGSVHVVQGVYWSCRGCTGRARAVQVVIESNSFTVL